MKKICQTCRWIVFLFLTFLCSCTNDVVNNREQFLRQIIEIAIDGTSNTTFINYDGNKIVSIENDKKRSDFYYTGILITKIEEFDKVTSHLITFEYIYSDTDLEKIISSDNYTMNYIHNDDGSVSYEKLIKDSNNDESRVLHGILYFQNTNLIKDDMILDDAEPNVLSKKTINFEYDFKNNAFHNILGFSKLLNYYELISLNNNIISTEAYEIKNLDTDQVISSINLYKSEYKYDSEGYPKEIVSEKLIFGNWDANHLKTLLYYD